MLPIDFKRGAICTVLLVVCCGAPHLRAPTYVQHPSTALTTVIPFPPPPARTEIVPASPNEEAVWLDGEWSWQGKRWAWKTGRWVIPPKDAAFSPWTAARTSNGTLYFAPGTWRDAKGNPIADPPSLGRASARGGAVISADGEIEDTGRVRDERRRDGGDEEDAGEERDGGDDR